jgi:F-type H+-transporting ATPase subunit delta
MRRFAGGALMQEAARVYAEALFDVAKDKGKLDAVRGELAQFADAVDGNRELQVFFFSPYFSSAEKVAGLKRAVSDADAELINFLELLIEKQRMPEIFRIRRQLDELWKQENRRIDVTVTSAVTLEPSVVEKVGEEIERQTGQKVELSSRVDAEILGGIVLQVGNKVLDASIRSRLEKLRKSVAQAA